MGKLHQLFESATAEPERRKCLNGLHFPDPLAGLDVGVHASDTLALRRTRDELGCPRTFDSTDVAFRLVATEGAFHLPHIDNCGDATWVHVITGEKVWFFLEPKNPSDRSSTALWTSHTLDMSNLDLSIWHVRVVLLTPGTKMCVPIEKSPRHRGLTDSLLQVPPSRHAPCRVHKRAFCLCRRSLLAWRVTCEGRHWVRPHVLPG